MTPDESGPMEPGYGTAYFQLAARVQPTRCLEIGAETGQSAVNLLLACPRAHLTSVDVNPCEKAFARLEGAGVIERWKLRRGDSRKVVPKLGTFDWIYVDGDHSYEAVREDLRNAWGKLKQGGTLVVDDYGIAWVGVKDAADEFAAEHGLVLEHLDGHPYDAVYVTKP